MLKCVSAGAVLGAKTLLAQPSAFGAAVLRMPFLDVFTTMMDSLQSMTHHEWDEWGNPNEDGGVDLLKSICPYQVCTKCFLTGWEKISC